MASHAFVLLVLCLIPELCLAQTVTITKDIPSDAHNLWDSIQERLLLRNRSRVGEQGKLLDREMRQRTVLGG
ncbi:hypothetical protein E5D57_008305 [Metarhizium anisopliae]|nr:hypothetical protein E5D57_008305 [Metarhizium anisopliae]